MVKIPSHADKVFSGVIFDIYQWDQEMFNGTTATFEAARRPSTVVVIPVVNNTIALAYERQPGKDRYTTMVSGRIDPGEEPLAAAQRELAEEAWIVSDDWILYKDVVIGWKVDQHIYYFIAKNCHVHGNQQLDPGWEEIEIIYADFDRFISFVQSEKCQDVAFANDIFRLEKQGKLDQFKDILFS